MHVYDCAVFKKSDFQVGDTFREIIYINKKEQWSQDITLCTPDATAMVSDGDPLRNTDYDHNAF